MHTIAILGFFTLVVVFFFTGKNDFGLKPTPKKNIPDANKNLDNPALLEEMKN
tara:strand:- start:7364 stop:7522 length:159 start_codon:yes stop_codon:yes gene_type:complete